MIVGTPKDPTPEIQSTMRGFQTNPYWTVPQSISGEEYLPMLRRDPNALQAAGFKIFENWSDDTELDPSSIDWSSIHPKAFPYRIRQEPGAGNALGYIFFPFPNRYGIYMHDTANRWLFTEGSRNFSHGCIRLQNPLDFAEKAFGGRNGFSKERVRQVIDAGQQAHYTLPRADHALRDLPHGDGRRRRACRPSATTSTAATAASCGRWRSLDGARASGPPHSDRAEARSGEWPRSAQRFLARSFFQYSRRFRISRSKPRSTGW